MEKKNKFYNESYKLAYLDFLESDHVVNRHVSIFNRSAKVERDINKELFNMTIEEIEEVLFGLKSNSVESALQSMFMIRGYIRWAIENGYSKNETTRFPNGINRNTAAKYEFKSANTMYTREEFLNGNKEGDFVGINGIEDIRYSTCLLCIFEGIDGMKASEISYLKMDDIKETKDGYIVVLEDREFPISDELYNRLRRTDKEREVPHLARTKLTTKPLAESPYIFKKVKQSNADKLGLDVGYSFRDRAIKKGKEVFNNKKFTSSNIVNSGMSYLANELMNESGKRVLTYDILDKVSDIYKKGKVTNRTNVVHMLECIDLDFIRLHYGEFETNFIRESDEYFELDF